MSQKVAWKIDNKRSKVDQKAAEERVVDKKRS